MENIIYLKPKIPSTWKMGLLNLGLSTLSKLKEFTSSELLINTTALFSITVRLQKKDYRKSEKKLKR